MSIIINFFSGPGAGKSTQASELFTLMKKNHMDVELTFEFPKMIAWEENYSAVKDQFYITANQHRNISRLYGKVEYIIVDSPIILGLVYNGIYGNKNDYPTSFYDNSFDIFIIELFKKYKSLNILLKRDDKTFNGNGRLQNLQESKHIDEKIKEQLEMYKIPFIEFPVCPGVGEGIFNYIKSNTNPYVL
jgi:hypothetical protein